MDYTPPASDTARTLKIIAIVAAAVGVVWALGNVVMLIFGAALLACVLRGAGDWLAPRVRLSEGAATALVAVLLVLALAGAGYWIAPRLFAQLRDLVSRVTTEWNVLRHHFDLSGANAGTAPAVLKNLAGEFASPVETMLGLSFHMVLGLVVALVVGLYLAADPALYRRGVLHLLPPERRPRTDAVMLRVEHVLQLWVVGQLVDMVVVGVLATAGLFALGVPAPFALGLLAGLLTFVPYLGSFAGSIPAVLVALSVSLSAALFTILVFVICHTVEGYIVSPLVQRRLVRLPPALTILSMTIAGTLFGVLGVVLGTPLAAAALVSVQMLYVQDVMENNVMEGRRLPSAGNHTARGHQS